MGFEVLKSEIVYPGRAFTIRRDTLKLPNGRETRLDVVEHIGSVVIVPVDQDGNVLFVSQYRHPVKSDLLELPAGTLNPGEEYEACARREIREETGMAAEKMEELGGFYLAPGYSTEFMKVFLATGLKHDPLEADADEILSLARIPLKKALEMAEAGQIQDGKSLAAFFLARKRLAEA